MANMKVTKVSRQAQLQKILSGIASHYQGVTNLTLGGKTVVLADFTKRIQKELDDILASAKARDEYAAQVQTERTTRAQLAPTLRQFKSCVLGSFGDTQDSIAVLGDFGYSPRKSHKATVAVKAEAQVLAKATRKARGTVGPKAKAKIKSPPPVPPAPKV